MSIVKHLPHESRVILIQNLLQDQLENGEETLSSLFLDIIRLDVPDLECLKLLLEDTRISTNKDFFLFYVEAIKLRNKDIIKILLAGDKLTHNIVVNDAFIVAIKDGITEIVEIFMNDDKVNPNFRNNYAIRIASERGYVDIVKLLLLDVRVSVFVNNHVILNASNKGHIDIVKLLIPYVDLATIKDEAIHKISQEMTPVKSTIDNLKEIISILSRHAIENYNFENKQLTINFKTI